MTIDLSQGELNAIIDALEFSESEFGENRQSPIHQKLIARLRDCEKRYTIVTKTSAHIGMALGLMTETEARERYARTVPNEEHTVQLVKVLAVERGVPVTWEMIEEKTQ